MPISLQLQPVPDLAGRVVNPNQVSLSEIDPIAFSLNRGGDVRQRSAFRKGISYQIPGLTGNEVLFANNLAEQNLVRDIQAQTPTLQTIQFSGLTFPNCYMTKVTPTGSLNVANQQIVEQTTILYETIDRYLI